MTFSFHPGAEKELLEAIDYYESYEVGLGHDFAIEVYAAIERAVSYPKAWPIVEGEVRRAQTRRFPYGILYAKAVEGILILAVMHLHRDPEYWKDRIP